MVQVEAPLAGFILLKPPFLEALLNAVMMFGLETIEVLLTVTRTEGMVSGV